MLIEKALALLIMKALFLHVKLLVSSPEQPYRLCHNEYILLT